MQLLFKYLYVQAKEGWYMSVENKRAEREKTADFSQAGQDGGNNSPFRYVSSSALSLPASPPPFLLTPYMVCSLKGFSCSWKCCYGCLEQKIKDHLLFIKHILRTFEEANIGTFSCVFCLMRPSSQLPKTRPTHNDRQKALAVLSPSPFLSFLPFPACQRTCPFHTIR